MTSRFDIGLLGRNGLPTVYDPRRGLALETVTADIHDLSDKISDNMKQFSKMLDYIKMVNPSQHGYQSPNRFSASSCSSTSSWQTVVTEASLDTPVPASIVGARTKTETLIKSLVWAAPVGNVDRVQECLPLADIDEGDDLLGFTPLMCAACFGQEEVVRVLLAADRWTALMWAVSRGHGDVVKILLANNASKWQRNDEGQSVVDVAKVSGFDISTMLLANHRRKSTLSRVVPNEPRRQSTAVVYDVYNAYYQSTEDDIDGRTRKHSMDASMLAQKHTDSDALLHWMSVLDSTRIFHWDKCLPDQMLVFWFEDIGWIVDTIAAEAKIASTRQTTMSCDIWGAANTMFLCVRFTCAYANRHLFGCFMDACLEKATKMIQSTTSPRLIIYWMSNLVQFLTFMDKDTGCSANLTCERLETIKNILSNSHTRLQLAYTKELDKMLESCILIHNGIDHFDALQFEQETWVRAATHQRNTLRQSLSYMNSTPTFHEGPFTHSANSSEPAARFSPSLVIKFLDQIRTDLDLFGWLQPMAHCLIACCLDHISRTLINLILADPYYLCRSKAMQIRLNISAMEEWKNGYGLWGFRRQGIKYSVRSYRYYSFSNVSAALKRPT